ncbi:hypothetical protein AAVH_10745 [Aphelenchoides avenae]|nr:hypothetical protein AAVH_10745 [Aphelenchus avenae]
MSVPSILLLALLATVASAAENPKPLVEHSIRVDGHVKCAGVPVENATVSLVFVVQSQEGNSLGLAQ